jgi:hypothetical protein
MEFSTILSESAAQMARIDRANEAQFRAEMAAVSVRRDQLRREVQNAKNLEGVEKQLNSLEIDLREQLDWTHEVLDASSRYRIASSNLEVAKRKLQALIFFDNSKKVAATLTKIEDRETVLLDAKAVLEQVRILERTAKPIVDIERTAMEIAGSSLTVLVDCYHQWLRRRRIWRNATIAVWGLIVMTLVVSVLLDMVKPKWLSLLLLPAIVYFLQKSWVDPWFESIMFERHRTDLLSAVDGFYYSLFVAKCILVTLAPLLPAKSTGTGGTPVQGARASGAQAGP